MFTNISARWPGSAHDSHVFRTSAIGRHLQNNYHGIQQGVLLGDSGYPCRPFLLTPYRQANDAAQQRFNNSHCSTRSIIERAFGIWKKRFHILGSEVCITLSTGVRGGILPKLLEVEIKHSSPPKIQTISNTPILKI